MRCSSILHVVLLKLALSALVYKVLIPASHATYEDHSQIMIRVPACYTV